MLFYSLVERGYILNRNSFYAFYMAKEAPEMCKIKKPDKIRLRNWSIPYYEELERIVWGGTLGELAFMATQLYGVNRWYVIRHYYKLPNRKINIRSAQQTLSGFSAQELQEKYIEIQNLLEE